VIFGAYSLKNSGISIGRNASAREDGVSLAWYLSICSDETMESGNFLALSKYCLNELLMPKFCSELAQRTGTDRTEPKVLFSSQFINFSFGSRFRTVNFVSLMMEHQ
jgi:hypothetical protein